METLDKMQENDLANYKESKRVLRGRLPMALPAVQEASSLLEQAVQAVSSSSIYDDCTCVIEEWARVTGLRGPGGMRLLDEAHLVGSVDGVDRAADAKGALGRAVAFHIRMQTFLRIHRDLLLGYSELLRLRMFSAFGFIRLQIEAAALIRHWYDQPSAVRDWMRTHDRDAGRKFHQTHSRHLKKLIRGWDLEEAYDEACGAGQHCRFMSQVPGVLIAGRERSKPGVVGLTYTDIDDAEILMLWLWRMLAFHTKLLVCLEAMFPDAGDGAFRGLDRANLKEQTELVYKSFRPQYEAYRKRGDSAFFPNPSG